MLSKIRTFFSAEFFVSESDSNTTVDLSEQQRQLACAALMIEVATIDHNFDQQEFAALLDILQEQFSLDQPQLDALTQLAREESKQSTSLYQFTQLVNNHCSRREKFQLIRGMWKIAYADGNLDKYEEHLIRKVADLIYVPHSEFIQAKKQAKPEG